MRQEAPSHSAIPKKRKSNASAMQVIERAIASGHFVALLGKIDPHIVREAQHRRVGLIHAAMGLPDPIQRNSSMSLLVNLGADVNAVNVFDRTALHEAAQRHDLSGMDVLMGLGADLDAQDAKGWTPLHCCAQTGRIRSATRLISAGANPFLRNADGHLFTDLGNDSFAAHMELLMDVRRTIHTLDVALEVHAGIPRPVMQDSNFQHE
jgi:ankyrin repeat protein